MPKIYSEEKRQEIKEQLMDVGLEIIKQYGLKQLNIESITRKVGVAQGTFYNFFSSKEMLVYSIAHRYQGKLNDRTRQWIDAKGYLDRADLYELYYKMMLEDEDNVYRYLKREDVQVLITRLPKDCIISFANIKAEIEHNLNLLKDKKRDCDLDAVINWIQIMNLVVENKDIMIEAGIEKILHRVIENMLDEIFDN